MNSMNTMGCLWVYDWLIDWIYFTFLHWNMDSSTRENSLLQYESLVSLCINLLDGRQQGPGKLLVGPISNLMQIFCLLSVRLQWCYSSWRGWWLKIPRICCGKVFDVALFDIRTVQIFERHEKTMHSRCVRLGLFTVPSLCFYVLVFVGGPSLGWQTSGFMIKSHSKILFIILKHRCSWQSFLLYLFSRAGPPQQENANNFLRKCQIQTVNSWLILRFDYNVSK